jgi:non-ribosomal peptide synthetase component F
VIELVRAAVQRDPRRTSVVCGEGVWSHGELWALATATAAALGAAGLAEGDVVAIHANKGVQVVAGLLAVLGSGAVAVPVDAALPDGRKRAMIEESGARLVAEATCSDGAWHGGLASVGLGHAVDGVEHEAAAWPGPVAPGAPAYIFFTSGTSGRPKAILGSHKGLAHFVAWERAQLEVRADDRVAQVTSLSFDAMLRDLFVPLAAGATVCLPGRAEVEDPAHMVRWLDAGGITIVHTAPSVLAAWAAAPREGIELGRLRAVCLAGEPLTGALVDRWRSAFPRCEAAVLNLYGPSETTMIKSFHRVPNDPPPGVLPIGVPLPDTQLLVLADGGERPCEVGEPGEIVIRTLFRTLGSSTLPPSRRPASCAARSPTTPMTCSTARATSVATSSTAASRSPAVSTTS